jgi:hypothetical protein
MNVLTCYQEIPVSTDKDNATSAEINLREKKQYREFFPGQMCGSSKGGMVAENYTMDLVRHDLRYGIRRLSKINRNFFLGEGG